MTGVTFHYIDEGIDTGNILLQAAVQIGPYDSQKSVFDKCMKKGAEFWPYALQLACDDNNLGIPQEGKSNYNKRGVPYKGEIEVFWEDGFNRGNIHALDRFIMAMDYPPYSYATYKGIEVRNIRESLFKESIRRIDMKFYGQGKIDVYLYENLFKDKQGGFFVECGAFDGRLESTCLVFEESMGWTGVNIEPVPHAFRQLIKNRPNCINLKYALSDTDHPDVFSNAIHPKRGRNFGNGSLKHCKEHMKDLVKQGCTFEKFNVQCKRFDNIVDEYGIQISIYLCWM